MNYAAVACVRLQKKSFLAYINTLDFTAHTAGALWQPQASYKRYYHARAINIIRVAAGGPHEDAVRTLVSVAAAPTKQ